MKKYIINGSEQKDKISFEAELDKQKENGLYLHSKFEDESIIEVSLIEGYEMAKISGACGC